MQEVSTRLFHALQVQFPICSAQRQWVGHKLSWGLSNRVLDISGTNTFTTCNLLVQIYLLRIFNFV